MFPRKETHWLCWYSDFSFNTTSRLKFYYIWSTFWHRSSWSPEDVFSTFATSNEMSQQLLHVLSWNLVQPFMVPRGWIEELRLSSYFSSCATIQWSYLFFTEINQLQSDEFSLVQIFIVPRGWIPLTLVIARLLWFLMKCLDNYSMDCH